MKKISNKNIGLKVLRKLHIHIQKIQNKKVIKKQKKVQMNKLKFVS